MYDNLPFNTVHKPTIRALITNEKADFIKSHDIYYSPPHCRAGEVRKTVSIFKYYNLTFTVIYDSEGELISLNSKGSFHYLKNLGKHNADNVTINEAINNLKRFAITFGIALVDLKLAPFEIAQMINIPFNVEETVMNTFSEQRKMFINNSAGNPSKISGKPSNDYRLKCYGKHAEHPNYCLPNTFRLEYQAKKMRVFSAKTYFDLYGAKIVTMDDLLKKENWRMLRDIHLEHFKHMVIFDNSIKLPKNSKFKPFLNEFSNPNNWELLIKKCKSNGVYKDEYLKKVATLRAISKKHGSDIHTKIIKLIDLQWFIFMNTCKETHPKLERFKADAPLLTKVDAPFIVCKPCEHFS